MAIGDLIKSIFLGTGDQRQNNPLGAILGGGQQQGPSLADLGIQGINPNAPNPVANFPGGGAGRIQLPQAPPSTTVPQQRQQPGAAQGQSNGGGIPGLLQLATKFALPALAAVKGGASGLRGFTETTETNRRARVGEGLAKERLQNQRASLDSANQRAQFENMMRVFLEGEKNKRQQANIERLDASTQAGIWRQLGDMPATQAVSELLNVPVGSKASEFEAQDPEGLGKTIDRNLFIPEEGGPPGAGRQVKEIWRLKADGTAEPIKGTRILSGVKAGTKPSSKTSETEEAKKEFDKNLSTAKRDVRASRTTARRMVKDLVRKLEDTGNVSIDLAAKDRATKALGSMIAADLDVPPGLIEAILSGEDTQSFQIERDASGNVVAKKNEEEPTSGDQSGDGFGPVEERVMKDGTKVKVKKDLETGEFVVVE